MCFHTHPQTDFHFWEPAFFSLIRPRESLYFDNLTFRRDIVKNPNYLSFLYHRFNAWDHREL